MRSFALVLTLAFVLVLPALADEGEKGAPQDPLQALASVVLAALVAVGVGAALAVLRVIVPGPVRRAETALEGLSPLRLLLSGVLPLLGAALLGHGIGETGVPALAWAYLLLVGLPLALLVLAGAAAAVPYLGASLLRAGRERSLLGRAVTGAVALALSMVTWALPPLGGLVTLLVLGWFLGAGFGVVFRNGSPAPDEGAPEQADPVG